MDIKGHGDSMTVGKVTSVKAEDVCHEDHLNHNYFPLRVCESVGVSPQDVAHALDDITKDRKKERQVKNPLLTLSGPASEILKRMKAKIDYCHVKLIWQSLIS